MKINFIVRLDEMEGVGYLVDHILTKLLITFSRLLFWDIQYLVYSVFLQCKRTIFYTVILKMETHYVSKKDELFIMAAGTHGVIIDYYRYMKRMAVC